MATNVIWQYGNQAGPVSKFQAFIGLRIAETSSTSYRLEYNHALWVCSGADFEGTVVNYEYWKDGARIKGPSTVSLYGSGWYVDSGWINAGWYGIGSGMSLGMWAGYVGGSGTSYNSNSDASYTVPGAYFDVNGLLDEEQAGNTTGYGTFDVLINGSTVSSGATDFYQKYTPVTTYQVTNIKASPGHTYQGIESGSLSGTINSGASVTLKFITNTYTISYNANGGTGAPTSQAYKYATSGTTTLSSTKPTRTGYTFLGWSTSSSASSATYAAGASFNKSVTSNTTLYAVWKANTYTISYNANGGSGAPNSQSYTYATSGTTILSATIPVKPGYEFLGWSTDASASIALYTAGGAYNRNIASNVTLYAVWKLTEFCTLSYDMNGGIGTIESQRHIKYTTSILSDYKPSRENYVFTGWSLVKNSTTADYLLGGKCVLDDFENESTVTLYAVWHKILDIFFKFDS